MDKTAESYAQKILAEIKRIVGAVERTPAQQSTSGEKAHEQEQGSYQRGDEPKVAALREQVAAKAKPSNGHENKPKDSHEKSHTFLRKHKPFIELLTLIFLVTYTSIAALQWCTSNRQANEAAESNHLLEESIRAQLSIEHSLNPVEAGKPVSEDLTITNVGHSLAFVAIKFGYGRSVELPEGDMPLGAGDFDKVLEPGKQMFATIIDPELIPQNFLDKITPLSDGEALINHKPRSETIYLYERIDYKTLGKTRTIEFCNFLARNDKNAVFPHSPENTPNGSMASSNFVLFTCPQVESSRMSAQCNTSHPTLALSRQLAVRHRWCAKYINPVFLIETDPLPVLHWCVSKWNARYELQICSRRCACLD